MPKRVPEPELIIPTLELLDAAPDGQMKTSDIIKALEEAFSPVGEDDKILEGRQDTKFTQKVRNLKSHKTFEKAGFAERIYRGFRITPAGRKLVRALRG